MSVITDARKSFKKMQEYMGTEITVKNKTVSFNSQSDAVTTFSETTVTAVVEPIFEESNEYGNVGRQIVGTYYVHLPYDTTISIDDEMVIESKTYRVEEISSGFPGATVYQQCLVREIS